VDDKISWVVALADSHAQSRAGQRSVEKLAHGPTDDAPAIDIQDCDQVQPALSSEDTGDISDPDLVRPSHNQSTHSVGSDRSTVTTVCRERTIFGSLTSKDSLLAHEPGDAITPSWTAQHLSQARTTISLATARKFFTDTLT
jgi:hypothetical protein